MRAAGRLGGWRGRTLAAAAGALAALAPAAALADGEASRALAAPADAWTVVAWLALGLAALLAATSIAYLYRKQRGLRWDYQLPEGQLSEGEGEPHGGAH